MNGILASILLLATFDIGQHFADKSSWEEGAVDFAVEHQKDGFTFASQKRDIVNCLRKGACTWNGLEVWEARVYYGAEGATRVELSLYNRGDDRSGRSIGVAELKEMLSGIAAKVEENGRLGNPEKKKLPTGGYQYFKRWSSRDSELATELTWGVNGAKAQEQTAQFVRLAFYPKGERRPKGATKSVSGITAKTKVKANVTKNAQGDVWIQNVPMVDQGQKGYCAAAVSERVLRYYGFTIDEHEIAQLAGTQSRAGTSQQAMIEAVKAIASKCHLGYSEVVQMITSFEDIEKDIEQYNKAAKAAKAPQLSMKSFLRGNMFDVGAYLKAKQPKVMKQVRVKDYRYKKFLAGVKTQIDQGVPVIWGVTLGFFPEPGVPQSAGGHMRLIIGYNQKTHEILYSDTWGAGHELKRMPEDWAFTITDSSFYLRPL